MPRINLLPWRDEERKERKLKFLVSLGAAAIAALAVTGVGYMMMDSMISAQDARNSRLKSEIVELDKQIEKINSLEADKARFIARMDVIEKLQRSRPEIVHVFDEIAKQLPDGVYLTGISQTGTRLKFEGVARLQLPEESGARHRRDQEERRQRRLVHLVCRPGWQCGTAGRCTREESQAPSSFGGLIHEHSRRSQITRSE
jgi:type IV pilus assembly protein PilN